MSRRGAIGAGAVAALLGALVFVIGVVIDPARAWRAYLTAVLSVMTIALGGLGMVMSAHLTHATWFVVLRRSAERLSGVVPVSALLLAPLALVLGDLYPWLSPASLEPHAREMVLRKLGYLNVPFFLARAVLYLTIWIGLVLLFRRATKRADRGEEPGPLWAWSAVGAILLGFTLTFAAFDWMMSLRPEWSSTIFGVRVFAGAITGALGALALEMQATGLPVRAPHAQALALLLVSFLLFWGYISFSQLLVIWIGNEPREIAWYVDRSTAGWIAFGLALLAGQFAVPFLLLLFRSVKCSVPALSRVGLGLVVMHYADMYWLIMPVRGFRWSEVWIDAAAAVAVAGVVAAAAVWLFGEEPALPLNDPELQPSLSYQEL